jgi:glutathione peroxidase
MSIYDVPINKLDGSPADLHDYEDKAVLVVNVASQCGLTPQYTGLEQIHEQYAERGFAVLGVPCNQFGGQEPGTAEEIAGFCRLNYGVTFPLFAKQVTGAGPDQSPVYAFLGRSGELPGWNFAKYLVGKDGKVRGFYPSKVSPDSPELRTAIERALAE